MIKPTSASETSVNFYQTTWHHNPEDSHLQIFLLFLFMTLVATVGTETKML
jgi:hypothetical protein